MQSALAIMRHVGVAASAIQVFGLEARPRTEPNRTNQIEYRVSVITSAQFHPFEVSLKLWAAFTKVHHFRITPKLILGVGGGGGSKIITKINERNNRKSSEI